MVYTLYCVQENEKFLINRIRNKNNYHAAEIWRYSYLAKHS